MVRKRLEKVLTEKKEGGIYNKKSAVRFFRIPNSKFHWLREVLKGFAANERIKHETILLVYRALS